MSRHKPEQKLCDGRRYPGIIPDSLWTAEAANPMGGRGDGPGTDGFRRWTDAENVHPFDGYRGTVRTAGHGERNPLSVTDKEFYTREELYRMLRRVELVLKPPE